MHFFSFFFFASLLLQLTFHSGIQIIEKVVVGCCLPDQRFILNGFGVLKIVLFLNRLGFPLPVASVFSLIVVIADDYFLRFRVQFLLQRRDTLLLDSKRLRRALVQILF